MDAVVCHACDVSCPCDLSLTHDGNEAGDFRTLKNFSIRHFVVPSDVGEVSKASGMEIFRLFFMVAIQ